MIATALELRVQQFLLQISLETVQVINLNFHMQKNVLSLCVLYLLTKNLHI